MHGTAPAIDFIEQPVASKIDAKAARRTLVPLLLTHLRAIGLQPEDVLDTAAAQRPALKESAPVKCRMGTAQGNGPLHEGQQ